MWAGLEREWAGRWGELWPRSAPGPAQGFCRWCSRHALGAESVLPASQGRSSLHSPQAGCSPCVLTDDSGTHGVTRSLWSHSQRPEGHCSQRSHTAQGRSETTVLLTPLLRYHGISQRLFRPQCFFIVPDTPTTYTQVVCSRKEFFLESSFILFLENTSSITPSPTIIQGGG